MHKKGFEKALHKNVDEINPRLTLGRVGFYHLSIDNIREHQIEFIPETSDLNPLQIANNQQNIAVNFHQDFTASTYSYLLQGPLERSLSIGQTLLGKSVLQTRRRRLNYSNFVYTKIVKKQ